MSKKKDSEIKPWFQIRTERPLSIKVGDEEVDFPKGKLFTLTNNTDIAREAQATGKCALTPFGKEITARNRHHYLKKGYLIIDEEEVFRKVEEKVLVVVEQTPKGEVIPPEDKSENNEQVPEVPIDIDKSTKIDISNLSEEQKQKLKDLLGGDEES